MEIFEILDLLGINLFIEDIIVTGCLLNQCADVADH